MTRNSSAAHRKIAALCLLLATSCARCAGPKSATAAEELLAAGTPGSVVTAPLGMVAQHASDLVDRVGKLPGGEQLTDTRRQLAGQLGFDPLTREGLLAAGLDPDRGTAASLLIPAEGRGAWVAALPLTKPDLFLQTFDRLARERAGYATRTDEPRGDLRIAVYARGEARGKLAVAVVKGYGVVARGDDPAADLVAAASRKETLALDPKLKAARDRLGAQDVVLFAPQGSPIPQRFVAAPLAGDAAVGLTGSGQGLNGRLALALPADIARRTQETWPGGGGSLMELLPGDAPLRARAGVSPQRLFAELQRFAPTQRILERVPEARDLFDSLEAGAVLSIALRAQANLGAAIDYGVDFRRKSPFDTVQLVALAHAKDAAKARKALAAIAAAAPQLGMKIDKRGADDYAATYEGGEGLRFGVRDFEGKPLVYALGGGVTPEQLHRTPKPAALDSAALYSDQGTALFVDFAKLAAAVHTLPEGAYGSGPQAYVARSVVSQVIEPLGAVRIEGGLVAVPDGVTADLAVGLSKP